MSSIEAVREIALTLPRSYEALVRGRVKFRVGRMVYLAFSRDEETMGFAFPKEERDGLVASDPDKFVLPAPSDLRYNWVVVRLRAIDDTEMRELVVDAWRMVVPKKVAAEIEAVTVDDEVEALYRGLLTAWNERDASTFGSLFDDKGSIVGFDGSCVESRRAITEHLAAIFSDHKPPTYVPKVREIRELGHGAALLRSVVGMVPPGRSDIKPELNAVQALVAVRGDDGWRIAHFHNTPARFDGRPQEAEALTAELRSELGRTA